MSVLIINASSCNTVIGYFPPCFACVSVDLPDPESPNTDATNLEPSASVYSFCPPWQEAYPFLFAIAHAIVNVPFLCSPKYLIPKIHAQFSAVSK